MNWVACPIGYVPSRVAFEPARDGGSRWRATCSVAQLLQKRPDPSRSPPILSRLDRHCEAAIAHEHQKYSAKEFPVGGSRRLHRPLGSLSLSARRRMRAHDRNIEMTGVLRLRGDRVAALCLVGIICAALPAAASAAVINRGVEGPPLSEIRPAPKSIYPDQQVITAQPSPSEVDPAYLGPVLLMKSAIVDLDAGTATLPLRKGRLEFRRTGLVNYDRHHRSQSR